MASISSSDHSSIAPHGGGGSSPSVAVQGSSHNGFAAPQGGAVEDFACSFFPLPGRLSTTMPSVARNLAHAPGVLFISVAPPGGRGGAPGSNVSSGSNAINAAASSSTSVASSNSTAGPPGSNTINVAASSSTFTAGLNVLASAPTLSPAVPSPGGRYHFWRLSRKLRNKIYSLVGTETVAEIPTSLPEPGLTRACYQTHNESCKMYCFSIEWLKIRWTAGSG